MIANLDYTTLQQLWWVLCSVVGALFLFLTFVQGGQTLLWQMAKTKTESAMIINSLGRKWELTFTTLVLFGGALFASFPKFYSTSFGGAYWVWILIRGISGSISGWNSALARFLQLPGQSEISVSSFAGSVRIRSRATRRALVWCFGSV